MRRATVSVVLRRAGFGVSVVGLSLFALMLVGETMSDPGGWKGVGLVAAWAVPLTGAILLAVCTRTAVVTRVFVVATAIVALLSVWFAPDAGGWQSFEKGHGPVRAVVVFALGAALAVYGLRRTGTAGLLLLVVATVPTLAASGHRGGLSSLTAAAAAPMITGLLYVLSWALAPHSFGPGSRGQVHGSVRAPQMQGSPHQPGRGAARGARRAA